jgi:hypothetical protein
VSDETLANRRGERRTRREIDDRFGSDLLGDDPSGVWIVYRCEKAQLAQETPTHRIANAHCDAAYLASAKA